MKNNYIKLFRNPSTVVEVREIQMQTPMHIRQTAIVTTMSPSPQAGSAKKTQIHLYVVVDTKILVTCVFTFSDYGLFPRIFFMQNFWVKQTEKWSNFFPRQQILDSSKLNDNFKFDENGRKLLKWIENIVGRGEIARY